MKRDAVDQIEIASPCTVPWSSMRGDDRVRFCNQCRQNVYNLEASGRAEAIRLLAEREGRLCVRIRRRSDGTVVTADCWTRLRAARRRGIAPFLAMLLVVAWAELVAMRFGLNGWRRFADPPQPPALGGIPLIPREPEPDSLQWKQGGVLRSTPAPHRSLPLVNPVLTRTDPAQASRASPAHFEDVAKIRVGLQQFAETVPGAYRDVDAVPTDPQDNPVVATALEGEADYLVTLDEHDLLALKVILGRAHRPVQIVSPPDFLVTLLPQRRRRGAPRG